jgi:hypothetical protein
MVHGTWSMVQEVQEVPGPAVTQASEVPLLGDCSESEGEEDDDQVATTVTLDCLLYRTYYSVLHCVVLCSTVHNTH